MRCLPCAHRAIRGALFALAVAGLLDGPSAATAQQPLRSADAVSAIGADSPFTPQIVNGVHTVVYPSVGVGNGILWLRTRIPDEAQVRNRDSLVLSRPGVERSRLIGGAAFLSRTA